MDKSDLAAAIASTSAISMAEAANAVEFVLCVMDAEQRLAETEMPNAANSNVPLLEQLVLFDELRAGDGGASPSR